MVEFLFRWNLSKSIKKYQNVIKSHYLFCKSKKPHSANAIDKGISSLKEMKYKRRFQLSNAKLGPYHDKQHSCLDKKIRGMQVGSSFDM